MAGIVRGMVGLKEGGNRSTELRCDQVRNLYCLTFIVNVII